MSFPAESLAMRVARLLGWEKAAWALRRLHCPVPAEALVLEIGSGGNPYARSNVLLDAYETTRERHWAPLIADRPIVLGFAERLPFRDGAFDFVIASHVLEHSADPSRFLAELQRVAKAGYIETPDAFMERMNPYRDHRLEITVREGRLLIRKKAGWRTDTELVELYEHKAKEVIAGNLIPSRPFDFHVRYYWAGHIDYEILNPGIDAGWPSPGSGIERKSFVTQSLRSRLVELSRAALAQRERNRNIDVASLLRCLRCGGTSLQGTARAIACKACDDVYLLRQDGILVTSSSRGA